MSKTLLRVYDDAVSVVTGAASGIGRALAKELAKRGSEVVLADLQVDLAEMVAEEIRAKGGKARVVELDVTDFNAVEKLLKETVEHTGRLDFMFNNAGIRVVGPVRLYSIEDWNRVLDVNLRGVVNGTHATYQIMLQQGFGHIVNTASTSGLMASPGETAYGMSKHGIVSLSRSLRAEAALANIRVSVLCPGIIDTSLLDGGKYGKSYADPERLQEMVKKMPKMLKAMSPEDFAIKSLDAVAKNKAIVIIPSWWKLFWWIGRLSPAFEGHMTQKNFENISRMLYDDVQSGSSDARQKKS